MRFKSALLILFSGLLVSTGAENPASAQPAEKNLPSVHQQMLYFRILNEYFTQRGFPPDYRKTLDELRRLNELLPPSIPRKNEAELRRSADLPTLQLNTAARSCFVATCPDFDQIPPEELSRSYQKNCLQYAVPADLQLQIISFRKSDRSAAEAARARILQGETPESIAKSLPVLPDQPSRQEIIALLRKNHPALTVGQVSPVVELSDRVGIAKVLKKTPMQVPSEKELIPYLREKIISKRCAEMMQLILQKELEAREKKLSPAGK